MTDKNCLSYWFPKLLAAGIPVPLTRILRLEEGEVVGDPDEVTVNQRLVGWLKSQAMEIPGPPWFLRTGQGSGKHNWKNTCFVQSPDDLEKHVAVLIEWSMCVDMMGLPFDVWVLREYLAVDPIAVLPAYGDMPLVREARSFIKDGNVLCTHQYWPMGSILEGFRTRDDRHGVLGESAARKYDRRLLDVHPLIERVAKVFAGDGAWSVDILETKRGLYVTDMAVAERSWHWPGCPQVDSIASSGRPS